MNASERRCDRNLRSEAPKIINFSMFRELCTSVHFFEIIQKSDSIEEGSG